MNTEDEKRLRQRVAQMDDATLVRTMYLFEKVREIDVGVEDMMRVVWPGRPFEAHPDLAGIQAMLRAELKSGSSRKVGGAEP
jgi:tetrahydromethanopterin S-methyltransferase subunit B